MIVTRCNEFEAPRKDLILVSTICFISGSRYSVTFVQKHIHAESSQAYSCAYFRCIPMEQKMVRGYV
jgi:hypothetical protein